MSSSSSTKLTEAALATASSIIATNQPSTPVTPTHTVTASSSSLSSSSSIMASEREEKDPFSYENINKQLTSSKSKAIKHGEYEAIILPPMLSGGDFITLSYMAEDKNVE